MKILDHKDAIIYHKDAMNRVFCLNQTVLRQGGQGKIASDFPVSLNLPFRNSHQ
ncbi:hypothetical protein HUN01_10995 [Nostoc edaphicum CCNP1411]|uniref:Uncharacterized protein n=1 Tax=Nostoc edaphicum CCNP1411 TaxID=1472755 RepID=A0A7D7LDF7_9NOSO|nr:hypothetical protein [Nostoc edaphicum]QMS88091.1 hypothetical protein HUN01_10995 [Nostoc edaphicum CCNP1411]